MDYQVAESQAERKNRQELDALLDVTREWDPSFGQYVYKPTALFERVMKKKLRSLIAHYYKQN